MRDAVLALDAIYGVDELDPRTKKQKDYAELQGGLERHLSKSEILKGAGFGIPNCLWKSTDEETRSVLDKVLNLLKESGANLYRTEIKNHEMLVSLTGWDWDFDPSTKDNGTKQSEYTYIKVDFYNNINNYLRKLKFSPMGSLKDIINYNKLYSGSEGGFPQLHPAFYSGQDGLDASLATQGMKDTNYKQALEFRQRLTREGIDTALVHKETQLNGLLVPLEPGQRYQVAAQAGYPMITLPAGIHRDSGMGIGLEIMQTAWRDDELVRWGSAIEDLMWCTQWKRTLPTWRGARERNLSVPL